MRKLALTLANKNIAFKVYMPFVEEGGIFIPTDEAMHLGDRVQLHVNVAELQKELSCQAVVVWISPNGAHSKQGIGVQFQGDAGEEVNQVLETYVAGMKDDGKKTFTL